jgi:xylulokinase
MEALFCGIDVGTQGARCVLVDAEGEVGAEAERGFPDAAVHQREGRFEQEPGAWTEALRGALSECLREVKPNTVTCVSVTSTSGTLCALDSGHRSLMPAIMYNDPRAEPEARQLGSAAADLTSRLGYRFSSSFGLPKILWLKRNRPELFGRAALFCSPTDYVIGWLTDEWGRSDQTNMLKFGYDLLEGRWPEFIEDRLGIPVSRLPRIQRSGELAGRVSARGAAQTGLPEGTPVVAGMTDGCASQISSGAAAPGQFNTTIGTTLVIKGVSERLLLDPLGRIYCHRHPAGWWLPGGASNTGAECLAREFDHEETERLSAAALEHSPTDLISYPLVGTGERFPFQRPEAEGFLLGEPGSREELFAAYLEGVACLERLAYDTLEELGARIRGPIFSAGGGSRSEAWLQIRADMLGRPVRRPAVTGAAMGAAILAATHEEFDGLPEATKAIVRIDREVEPRRDFLETYAEKYGRFRDACRGRGYI